VIVLEDDLEIAVDFFDYMTAVRAWASSSEPALPVTQSLADGVRSWRPNESLLAVSAWSDLGQAPLVAPDAGRAAL